MEQTLWDMKKQNKVVLVRNGCDTTVFYKDDSVDAKKVLSKSPIVVNSKGLICVLGTIVMLTLIQVLIYQQSLQ